MAEGRGTYGRRFDSGRFCLDLVATGAEMSGTREQIDGPASLAEWLVASRLVPRGTPLETVDETWVARFLRLRTGIDRLMTAQLTGGGADDDLEQVNALAAGAPPGLRAVRGQGGTLVRAPIADPACGALLAAVARDALDLLTDPVARAALRRCQGDACRRLYLDTSRGMRRRWCSSEVCGNRERVARHRRRAKALT